MAIAQLRAVAGKIRLEVVTPTGMALAEIVDEFAAPSVEGEFGVLPGHLPIMAALRTGLMSYRKGQDTTLCAVGPGFAEVADDHAVLLTDRFATKESIDVVRTRMRLKEVDEQLESWSEAPGSPEHQELIADEQWQACLLTLYGDPPPPTIRTFEAFEKKPEGKKAEEKQAEASTEPASSDKKDDAY